MPLKLLLDIVYNTPQPPQCRVYPARSDLRDCIESFVLYTSESDTSIELAMTDGRPCLIIIPDGGQCVFLCNGREQHFARGLLSNAVLERTFIKFQKRTRYIIVRFTDEGLYHILRQPLCGLYHRSCWNLEDISGPDFRSMFNALEKITSVPEQIRCMEDFFGRQRNAFQSNARFNEAASALRTSHGIVDIHSMARNLRVNYKWLERHFRKFTGLTPKEFGRVQRFLHACSALQKTGDKDLLTVALEAGYCDDDHFRKDFKRFTGKTPTAFFRSMM